MSDKYQDRIDAFMEKVKASGAHEVEFLQAVEEVAETVIPFIAEHPIYEEQRLPCRI